MTNSLSEELSVMPNDLLREKIITDVMKWKLICTRCKGTGRIPYIHGDIFKICEDCNAREKEYSESWNPLTIWNNTMEMVKELCGRRFRFDMHFDLVGLGVTVEDQKDISSIGFSRNSDTQRAICVATLIAIYSSQE